MKNFLLAGFLFFISSQEAYTCVRMPDSDLAIAGSYQSGKQVLRSKVADYTFGSCKKYAGQYFVLVAAPTYTDPLYKSISSAEGELPEDKCYIDQSPFSVSKALDVGIENFYHAETTFLNTCLEAEVTDTRGEIDALKQFNCEISQVSQSTVVAKGPRCAFKIYENSSFHVHYRLNPLCLDKDFLRSKGSIRPMDAKTSLSIYKTLNLEPGSPDYDILGMINGRITLQAENSLIPISKYNGTDASEWPMQYGAQVEFGRVFLSRTLRMHADPYIYLKTPFMVNNNCPEVCKDEICTSPCDYYAPVAARMNLKKKAAGESTFHTIDYWYQGNLVPSRFLGELSFGHPLANDNIVAGDEYVLTAEFSNPALSYKTIIDEARQLLIKLKPVSIPTGGVGGTQGLPGLGLLEGTHIVPDNPGMLGLGTIHDEQTKTDAFLNALNSLIGTEDSWPPYYTSVINGDLKDNANRVYQVLTVKFKVASVSSSGTITMGDVQYMKDSKIFGKNTDAPKTAAPVIKCSL